VVKCKSCAVGKCTGRPFGGTWDFVSDAAAQNVHPGYCVKGIDFIQRAGVLDSCGALSSDE